MDPISSAQHSNSSSLTDNTTPVWIRIPQAIRLFGIGRSSLYEAMKRGDIRSRQVKARRDSQRGIRLLSYDSLVEFIANQPE